MAWGGLWQERLQMLSQAESSGRVRQASAVAVCRCPTGAYRAAGPSALGPSPRRTARSLVDREPHLWCRYHNHGQGAWLPRDACFEGEHRRAVGAGAPRACNECDGPGMRNKPFSDAPTLDQCAAFFPKLSSRRQSAWRLRLYDGAHQKKSGALSFYSQNSSANGFAAASSPKHSTNQ